MDEFSQMKIFNYDRRLQVYMYDFVYVDTQKMTEEGYFTVTKTYVENYKKISTPVPVPKYWHGFSHICS